MHYTTYSTTTLLLQLSDNYNYTTTTPTPQLQLQLHLHLQLSYFTLHYTYKHITPHYNYNYNCATPQYIQQLWVGFALPSMHHNNSPLLYSCLSLPSPCAALLVLFAPGAPRKIVTHKANNTSVPQVKQRHVHKLLESHSFWRVPCVNPIFYLYTRVKSLSPNLVTINQMPPLKNYWDMFSCFCRYTLCMFERTPTWTACHRYFRVPWHFLLKENNFAAFPSLMFDPGLQGIHWTVGRWSKHFKCGTGLTCPDMSPRLTRMHVQEVAWKDAGDEQDLLLGGSAWCKAQAAISMGSPNIPLWSGHPLRL